MKTKGKTKQGSHKIPDTLDAARRLEFNLPCSVEAYADYLYNLKAGRFSRYHIYLSSVDQQQIQFQVCKSAYLESVWATGYLQATGENTCAIVGKTGLFTSGKPTIVLIVFFLAVMLFVCNNFSLSNLGVAFISLSPFLVFGLFLLACLVRIAQELTRESLVDDLYFNFFHVENDLQNAGTKLRY